MQTIHFNTGRPYTAKGQRITATRYEAGELGDNAKAVVTFCDHDRQVDGEYETIVPASGFSAEGVLRVYDAGDYFSTPRSYTDGFSEDGANARFIEGGE